MEHPSGQFLCLLYEGPQINLFVYYVDPPSDQYLCILYMGAPRLVYLNTIWGTLSDQFICLLYGPFRSNSFHTIWGPPQISFPLNNSHVTGALWFIFSALYQAPELCCLYSAQTEFIMRLPILRSLYGAVCTGPV